MFLTPTSFPVDLGAHEPTLLCPSLRWNLVYCTLGAGIAWSVLTVTPGPLPAPLHIRVSVFVFGPASLSCTWEHAVALLLGWEADTAQSWGGLSEVLSPLMVADGKVTLERNRRTPKIRGPRPRLPVFGALSRRGCGSQQFFLFVSDVSQGLQSGMESPFCSCLSFSSRTIPRAGTEAEMRLLRFIGVFKFYSNV